MATIDTLDQSGANPKIEGVEVAQEGLKLEGSAPKGADGVISVSKPASPAAVDGTSAPSLGQSLASLRGTPVNGSTPSASSNTPTLSVPHPKKFSHVDINKRFLEKTSSGSSSTQISSAFSAIKANSSIQKPALQTTPSHSRLVTAKLTAGPQPSTTIGSGWSRPSSTGSSVTPTPGPQTGPKPTLLPAAASSHGPPQPAPVGKVIQPQPRLATESLISGPRKDVAPKPAWGTAKPSTAVSEKLGSAPSEFPTAAEVAQVTIAEKQHTNQVQAQATPVHKQQIASDADAFRGVHLAPNTHHWDEDEGDDSNFLDEVIEFQDGRQYTIPTHTEPEEEAKPAESHDEPVSKEERFADDFDRSWPRSKQSGIPPLQRGPPHMSPSSESSRSALSPQESSRVLFNERSNRLEPYSQAPNRMNGQPRDSYISRRGSRSDHTSSPTEMRNGRDAPPHAQVGQSSQRQGYGVESGDVPPRSRVFGDRDRDRDMSRRDYGGPPHMSRTGSQSYENGRSRDYPSQDRSRRYSNMGPPPNPLASPNPSETSRDGRQLPPHLSSSHASQPTWRNPPVDRPRRLSTTSSVGQQSSVGAPSIHLPSRSPVAPHAVLSPAGESPSLAMSDEGSKAAMHSAAERARLRRQQEEEEREKERERARKKAAEIEAKMRSLEEEKTAPVMDQTKTQLEGIAINFIEDAVKSATSTPAAVLPSSNVEDGMTPVSDALGTGRALARPPSMRGTSRQPLSQARRPSSAIAPSPATEAESWRSKAAPPSAPLQPIASSHPSETSPAVSRFSLPLLAEVESLSLAIGVDENVEVLDFVDHGKLVGAKTTSTEQVHASQSRMVASDFFQDEAPKSTSLMTPTEEGSWRRKATVSPVNLPAGVESEHNIAPPKSKPRLEITPAPHNHVVSPGHSSHLKESHHPVDEFRPYHEHSHGGHSGHLHPLRSPLTPSYREAPMSTLNDTMARIKGALDGMHKYEHTQSPKEKWLPPALRAKSGTEDDRPQDHTGFFDESGQQETFGTTGYEPPQSPRPDHNRFQVRLPSVSVEQIPFKKIHLFEERPYPRTDIYSFVPAPDDITQRGFNLNDLVFHRPTVIDGRTKYFVLLPRTRRFGERGAGLVVNLPSKPAKLTGAFGRSGSADGASSWRKPALSPLQQQESLRSTTTLALDTVSCSPPPEAPSIPNDPVSLHIESRSSLSMNVPHAKTKTSSKPTVGADIAFYRDNRANAGECVPSAAVNFTVSSELDEEPKVTKGPEFVTQVSDFTSAVVLHTSVEKPANVAQPPEVKFNHKNYNADPPVTPPSQSTNLPWNKSPRALSVKDSPAQPPDRELLKAVWSATTSKPDAPVINSLEGIADDLPTVPLTIHDAKLETANTPPANAPHPPTKMSLHDVTRAFQQVPTSSSGNPPSQRNSSQPMVSSPQQRPLVASLPPPAMMGGMRPGYPGYPSPIMSSPVPAMVYPSPMTTSPIPRPMVVNGVNHQYPPPMWVPVPSPGGGPPPGMMRPVGSPYGHQLMPYSPGGPIPMYGPPPTGMQPGAQQMNGGQGRPGGMVMSPVAAHAQANSVYANSPVLLPTVPGMGMVPPPGYPVQAGPVRGPPSQMRGGYEGMPGVMQRTPSFSGPQPSYPTTPSNSYARPTW